jgi:hypothetical protein
MGIEKVLESKVVKSVKTIAKQNDNIKKVKGMFFNKLGLPMCPVKPEIIKINAKKNQIVGSLSIVLNSVNQINKIKDDTEGTLKTVDNAIKTIKNIPIPTAIIPPTGGVGIPQSILTKLSDTLDFLQTQVGKGLAAIESVKPIAKKITEELEKVIKKLNDLDQYITSCLILDLIEGMEWAPNKDYKIGDKVTRTLYLKALIQTSEDPATSDTWEGLAGPPNPDQKGSVEDWQSGKQYEIDSIVKIQTYYDALADNNTKIPENFLEIDWAGTSKEIATEEEGAKLAEELNFSAVDPNLGGSLSSNVSENEQAEIDLEAALTTPPGLLYGDYYLLIENDAEETIVPRRRIVATHKDDDADKLFNDYSFSATTQVLFEEMKYRIDTLGMDLDISLLGGPYDEVGTMFEAFENMILNRERNEYFTSEDAYELFEKAYALSKKGPGDDFYDSIDEKASQNGNTILEEAILSYEWLFRTGRINTKAWIKNEFGVTNNGANEIYKWADKFTHNFAGESITITEFDGNVVDPPINIPYNFVLRLAQPVAYTQTQFGANAGKWLIRGNDRAMDGHNVRRQAVINIIMELTRRNVIDFNPSGNKYPYIGYYPNPDWGAVPNQTKTWYFPSMQNASHMYPYGKSDAYYLANVGISVGNDMKHTDLPIWWSTAGTLPPS